MDSERDSENPHNDMEKKIAMAGAMLLSKRPLEAHQPSDQPGLEDEENVRPELPDIGPEHMPPAKRPRSGESGSRQSPPQTQSDFAGFATVSMYPKNFHCWIDCIV